MHFKQAEADAVCSDRKFLWKPKVILTNQITIICFATNNWETDVY